MASPRRHSRTPQVLTRDQQEAYVNTAETNPDIERQLERILGKPVATMTFQEKVNGLSQIQERGFAEGSLAGAVNGSMDLTRALDRRDFGIETHDRLTLLEQENADLREANAELRQTNAELRSRRSRKAVQESA